MNTIMNLRNSAPCILLFLWTSTGFTGIASKPRPAGRYTFTTVKHYDAAAQVSLPPRFITKDSQPYPSGLVGPVTLKCRKTVERRQNP